MSSTSRSGSSSSTCCGDRPDASKSNTSVTRMRSPRTQGRPPHWSGFAVIRSARAANVHSSVTGYTATQPDAHQDAPQPAETLRRQLAVLVLQTTSRSRIRPPPEVRSIAARSPVPRPAARRHRCAGWWCCRVWFRASSTMTCAPSCRVTVTCFEQCRNRGCDSCFQARRCARCLVSRGVPVGARQPSVTHRACRLMLGSDASNTPMTRPVTECCTAAGWRTATRPWTSLRRAR
jgi:hypothetical protein